MNFHNPETSVLTIYIYIPSIGMEFHFLSNNSVLVASTLNRWGLSLNGDTAGPILCFRCDNTGPRYVSLLHFGNSNFGQVL